MSLVEKTSSQNVIAETAPRRPVYILLGMHRSGTSLCSSIVHALGVDMADERLPERGNQFGHWERADVMIAQDAILNALDRNYYSPTHDFPLPAGWWRKPEIRPHVNRLKTVVASALDRAVFFGFKDPRTAKLMPVWTEICTEFSLQPKYVVCLRNPAHVAASLKHRDGLDPLVGEFRWLDYTVDCLRYTIDQDVHLVFYEDWFTNSAKTTCALQDFLALPVRYQQDDLALAIDALIRPDENHGDVDRQRPKIPLVRHFYDLVRQAAAAIDDAPQIRSFLDHFLTFRQLLAPFENKLRDVQAKADQEARKSASQAAALENQDALHRAALRDRDAAALIRDETWQMQVTQRDAELERLKNTQAEKEAETAYVECDKGSVQTDTEIAKLNELLADKDREIAALRTTSELYVAETEEKISRLKTQLVGADRDRADTRMIVASMREQLVQIQAQLARSQAAYARAVQSLYASSFGKKNKYFYLITRKQIQYAIEHLFLEEWYLDQNPDVKKSGMTGIFHYVTYGFLEGRNPHPDW